MCIICLVQALWGVSSLSYDSTLKMILVGNGPIHVVWNKPVLWSKSGSCGEIICIVRQVCALWAIWGVQVIFMGFDREGVIQFCVLQNSLCCRLFLGILK